MRLRKENRTKYKVSLTSQEREHLQHILHEGIQPERVLIRAKLLLLAGAGETDADIRKTLKLGKSTPTNIRRKYMTKGLYQTLFQESGRRK